MVQTSPLSSEAFLVYFQNSINCGAKKLSALLEADGDNPSDLIALSVLIKFTSDKLNFGKRLILTVTISISYLIASLTI